MAEGKEIKKEVVVHRAFKDKVVDIKAAELKEVDKKREPCSLVFIGHVDAGKSTICGNLMLLNGVVDPRTVEKFKITNPTKVNSVVSFELGDSSGGDAGDVGSFTVQPASWDIPAHEYRYVSVYFRPKETHINSRFSKASFYNVQSL